MDGTTLKNLMKNVCLYFGKKEPTLETYGEWMKDLSSIPSEPMDWIESKIKASKYPDNPPQAVRKLWFLWLEENPGRQIKEKSGCSTCEDGYLWVVKDGFNYVFRCDICNKNGANQGIKQANREWFKNQGYVLLWVHGSKNQIKSLPQYERGRRMMSKGLVELLDNQFKLPDNPPF